MKCLAIALSCGRIFEKSRNRLSMKLIIPMAGRGTRLRPHTHVTPKPLLPVAGKPMVERIVETFMTVLPRKLEEAVFVLGDFPVEVNENLETICGRHGVVARFARQDEAKGTGHATYCARDYLEGEVIVVFADTLFSMSRKADLDGVDALVWTKEVEDPSRFGVAVKDEAGRVVSFVEKPSEPISNEALIGINYVRDGRQLLKALDYIIQRNITGHGDEYQLTDALDLLIQWDLNLKTTGVDEWLDCGTIDALLDTSRIVRAKEQGPMPGDSVTDSTIVGPVFIGPGASVVRSVVGPHVTIEAGATVSDSVVSDSILFEHATVSKSTIQRSVIGRFATVDGYTGATNLGDHSSI